MVKNLPRVSGKTGLKCLKTVGTFNTAETLESNVFGTMRWLWTFGGQRQNVMASI